MKTQVIQTVNVEGLILPPNNENVFTFKGKTFYRYGYIRQNGRKYDVIIVDYIIPLNISRITTIMANNYASADSILRKYVP